MAKKNKKTLEEKLQAVKAISNTPKPMTDITISFIGRSELNPFELVPALPIEGLPGSDDGYYSNDVSYVKLVESFAEGIDWFIVGGFVNWEGDSFFFGRDVEGNVYYLNSGYGTCSYCDALQRCGSDEDTISLRNAMRTRVRKYPDVHNFVSWFEEVGVYEVYSPVDFKHFQKLFNEHYGITLKASGDMY